MDRRCAGPGRWSHLQPDPDRDERTAQSLIGYGHVPHYVQQNCDLHHLLPVRSTLDRLRVMGRLLVVYRRCAWSLRCKLVHGKVQALVDHRRRSGHNSRNFGHWCPNHRCLRAEAECRCRTEHYQVQEHLLIKYLIAHDTPNTNGHK